MFYSGNHVWNKVAKIPPFTFTDSSWKLKAQNKSQPSIFRFRPHFKRNGWSLTQNVSKRCSQCISILNINRRFEEENVFFLRRIFTKRTIFNSSWQSLPRTGKKQQQRRYRLNTWVSTYSNKILRNIRFSNDPELTHIFDIQLRWRNLVWISIRLAVRRFEWWCAWYE